MADILSNLKTPPGSRRRRKRVGRGIGSGHGKTCCRGQKGYGARAGSGGLLGFEGGQMPLYRRLPKRGFKSLQRKCYTVINIKSLEKWGLEAVDPEVLMTKGLLGKIAHDGIKLLGDGEPTRAYKVAVHKASAGAKEKIEKAGGEVKFLASGRK